MTLLFDNLYGWFYGACLSRGVSAPFFSRVFWGGVGWGGVGWGGGGGGGELKIRTNGYPAIPVIAVIPIIPIINH